MSCSTGSAARFPAAPLATRDLARAYGSAARSLALLLLALGACGDTNEPAPADTFDATEVEDLTGRSVYRLETEVNGEPLILERDLTDVTQAFAFGSQHIAPAIAFAMTDSVTFPRTVTVSLNFGVVVGSDAHPVHTGGLGTWPLSATPPSIDVFVAGLQYRSTLEGASGQFDITQWSLAPGQPVAGRFSGTLVADGNPARTLPVSGHFHFTLPVPSSGQPR